MESNGDPMSGLLELDGVSGFDLVLKALAEAAAGSRVSIKLSKMELGDEDMFTLATAFSTTGCHIVSLDLTWNNITDKGAKRLAASFPVGYLYKVALCHNQMGDEGVAAFTTLLVSHATLAVFYAFDNNLTDGIVTSMANFTVKTPQLRELGFGKNNIEASGVAAMISSLQQRAHPPLRVFTLVGCPGWTDETKTTADGLLASA